MLKKRKRIDFEKIHSKQFSKLEDLTTYYKKKQQVIKKYLY